MPMVTVNQRTPPRVRVSTVILCAIVPLPGVVALGFVGVHLASGRAHGDLYHRASLGGNAGQLDVLFERKAECRFSFQDLEVRYYLRPGLGQPTSCSGTPIATARWTDLPTTTYEAATFVISKGRIVGKQFMGESDMELLPGFQLPDGASEIHCCGSLPSSTPRE
jgi:hypothetical protein